MKRILHISKYYYPFRGGTEQIAQDLVEALKGSYEQKVICFNHDDGDKTDIVGDTEIIRCGCFAKIASQSLSVSYGRMLQKVLATFKPDIIVFHYPNPFVASFLLKYIKKNTRLVIYWHLDIVKQKILGRLFSDQNKQLVKRADLLIATSPNYVEGSKYLSLGKDKCVVVPNCVNTDRLAETRESRSLSEKIRKRYKNKIVCVAVGRHTEYKGFKYLIEASKYLDSRFQIFITGKGELTSQLMHMASGDDKIHFVGMISDDRLKGLLRAADIFCFPSITKNEAFGVALAEAMYYEKPAVTFTIPGSGVNYVSVNGETGIEVENGNAKKYAEAMIKLADDKELRERLGKAGKRRVEENFLSRQFVETAREIFGNIE